jgi:DNA-binding CsgD family transcriptional regulator
VSPAATPSLRANCGCAQIASRGLSSVEIAQTLFVTKNTVDTHLGRCYTKLGIKSRERLSVALDDHVDGKIIR